LLSLKQRWYFKNSSSFNIYIRKIIVLRGFCPVFIFPAIDFYPNITPDFCKLIKRMASENELMWITRSLLVKISAERKSFLKPLPKA